MVSGDFFSSLMLMCYCVSHVLRYSVHWNCCTEEMRSFLDLLEVEGSLARKLRFHLFNLEFEGSLARKLCFQILNSWNLKARTKASFSHLPLLKFEGRLARKLAFCNSMFADRSGMAASRLLLAAAACVILLRFAAGNRKSYCNGSLKRVKGALGTVFF